MCAVICNIFISNVFFLICSSLFILVKFQSNIATLIYESKLNKLFWKGGSNFFYEETYLSFEKSLDTNFTLYSSLFFIQNIFYLFRTQNTHFTN